MHKPLIGAALAAATLVSGARASETSWLELDSNIASLASTSASAEGMSVSGYIRNYYTSDSDNDVGGFKFEAVRIALAGSVGDYSTKVTFDLKSGAAALKDAYVSWACGDSVSVKMGQFKRNDLYSHNVSSSRLLFIMPTLNGKNGVRDNGLQVGGALTDMGTWSVHLLNGSDGASEDLDMVGRVAFDVAGEGAFNKHEGAVDAAGGTNVSVGVAYMDDQDDTTGGSRLALEAAAEIGSIYLHADMIDYDADFGGLDANTGMALGDTSPMSATVSTMVGEDKEVGLRWEDWDDADATERLSVTLNWYQLLPHKAKWSLGWSDMTSDDTSLEATLIQFGLTLSF